MTLQQLRENKYVFIKYVPVTVKHKSLMGLGNFACGFDALTDGDRLLWAFVIILLIRS